MLGLVPAYKNALVGKHLGYPFSEQRVVWRNTGASNSRLVRPVAIRIEKWMLSHRVFIEVRCIGKSSTKSDRTDDFPEFQTLVLRCPTGAEIR